MPAPCGVPAPSPSTPCSSSTPASSHLRISRRIRGSAIRCATIRSIHSWSTESKKLRMSASSTQFTYCVISAVCSAASASCGLRARAETRTRSPGSRLRRWRSAPRRPRPGQSCPPAPGCRAAADRRRPSGCTPGAPAAAGSARCARARSRSCSLLLQLLLVARHRLPVDSRAGAPLQSPKRALQRLDSHVMQQRRESRLLVSRLLPRSPARGFAGKASRLCVRTLAFSRGFPSGRPLPSTRLVSFGGFIGTMSRSDSRPQLGSALRFSLARRPRRRPSRRTRPGLLGSDDDLSYVMRSTTPAERHRLAYRRRTCCLRWTGTTRPPRHSDFRG